MRRAKDCMPGEMVVPVSVKQTQNSFFGMLLRRYWGMGFLALLPVLLVLNRTTGWKGSTGIPVQLGTVEQREMSVEINASGSVEMRNPAEINSPFDQARVDELYVRAGQRVSAGQPLVRLNCEAIEDEILRNRAEYWAAQRRLAELGDGAYQIRLQRLRLAVEQKQTDLLHKQQQLQKFEQLHAEGVVSKDETNRLKIEVIQSAFALEDSRLELQMAEKEPRETQIHALRSELQQKEEALRQAEQRLDFGILQAPFSGNVLSIAVSPGSVLRKGELLLKMADLQDFDISTLVNEIEIGQVALGMKARVKSDFFNGQTLEGKVARIVPQVRSERGAAVVQVLIETISSGGQPPPAGMTVDVQILVAKANHVKVVPLEAIVQRKGKKVLFVFQKGHARLREITIGLHNASHAEICKGVEQGEQVITSGLAFLQDGASVQPRIKDAGNGGMSLDLFK